MKRIFTYWHSEVLPDFVRACILTWRRTNPSYEISIYNREMFEKEFEIDVSSKWNTDISHQLRSDYVRLCLLEKYGGFWIDASIIITDSIDIFLENDKTSGFSSPDNFHPIMDSWFIYAPLGDQLLIDWKREFIRAFEMDCHNYKPLFKQYIDDAQKQGKIDPSLEKK